MINRGYAYAIRAMGSLEMYREMHSSSPHYQHELNHVIQALRQRAETMSAPAEASDKKFLLGFADALEQADKPGDYIPRSQG